MSDLRPAIQSALSALASGQLRDAAKSLLKTLGYESDRTLNLEGSKPQAFLDLIASQGGQTKFDEAKALFPDWKSADILFQLSDADISREASLFKDTTVQPGLLQSYLFLAIELKGKDYARGKLTAIARQINRVFPMPVMLLIRHGDTTGTPVLSIAVINRRRNKVHAEKDVLEKVTLIRDVSLASPHRGHLDILASFAVENLVHPKKLPIQDFDTLHAAWEQIFNVELLNARFYKELANWYFWALDQVDFPADLEPDKDKRNATGLIRLLTRLIFCWFLKEKGLIPENLFHPSDLAKILKGFDPESETSSTYYQAILQNLFFATLNQRMGKDGNGKPYRVFATDEGFPKNRATYDINNLYRYEKHFAGSQDEALALFADIPFLNGGLFECLDRTEDGTDKKRYLDGFSRRKEKRPHIPDRLFFDEGETADLSTAYGDTKRKAEKVTGLITILNRYKFTIVENTPIDQEIALDPELLGKVFENLLASYNEETKTTARKQTGSFYTPRPIVDYMVDESLKAHFERKLTTESTENTEQENQNSSSVKSVKSVVKKSSLTTKSTKNTETENLGNPLPSDSSSSALSAFSAVNNSSSSTVRQKLDHLFSYTEEPHQFTPAEVAVLLAAIDALKILDPACGSGAFPMGVLHKLVYILSKLDPDNVEWEKLQIAKVQEIADTEERRRKLAEIASNFADNNDDYGRKLYLIENCLYGVDIQPIAIQITKLRFFISLVCDQKTNRSKKDNHGIRPLPNLETKFVAANTLIGLPKKIVKEGHLNLTTDAIQHLQRQLQKVRHQYFTVQFRRDKLRLQKEDKDLRQKLAHELARSYAEKSDADTVEKLVLWDPFDPQSSAGFFDAEWMFGQSLADGFDVVIGNPPYGVKIPKSHENHVLKVYPAAKKVPDSYCFFILRGLDLAKKGSGYLSYIVPNTFCDLEKGDQFRTHILESATLHEIWQSGWAFESAVVDTLVFFASNSERPSEAKLKITIGEASYERAITEFFEDDLVKIDYRNPPGVLNLVRKIQSCSIRLGEIASVNAGVKMYETGKGVPPQSSDTVSEQPFSVMANCPTGWKPLYRGGDVGRYSLRPPAEFVNYGPWLAAARSPDLFQSPKILMRRTDDKLRSCIENESAICVNSCHVIKLNPQSEGQYSLPFLVGVLNAKLTQYIFEIQNPQMIGKTFAEVKVIYVERLFIPTVSPSQKMPLELLVERILTAKQTNPTTDTSAMERENDQQVYALYGLTPEEIAIVEGTAK